MFIEIGSRLKILDPSPELIKWCKENLEMTNPEYQQKARMHLWLGNFIHGITSYLCILLLYAVLSVVRV